MHLSRLSRSAATPRPWYQRVSPGLEGKLVLCFMVLLTAALGASFWTFVSETRRGMDRMGHEEAVHLTQKSGKGTQELELARLRRTQAENQALIRNVALLVLLIGAVATGVSLPLMFWLVHRVFQPIRQLVSAADRISRGDLETHVELDRSDVIGTLARSFNEMVKRVRDQQDELARANRKLADANAKLSDSNRDLEEKVRQRTAEVEAAALQLRAANRRLSSEIAEKEEFLRTVSHDLNAPLRNIAGMAATLLMKYRQTFEPDAVHRLERICRNVEVETDLIAELLELSRIKTRRQKIEMVDLNALLREVSGLFEQDLETHGIRLTVDAPMPTLYCERARLRQVFQNLIDNAIKYMGEGMEDSGVRLREIHAGGAVREGEAEFYVRDTGMGIAPQDLDTVFHVFRRGSAPAVQNVAGKGVGLASVKSIVESYSGTIWVESEPGRGSTVRFTINGKYLHVPETGATAVPGHAETEYSCPAA